MRSEKPFETDEEVEISDKRIKGVAIGNVDSLELDNVRSMDIDGVPIPLDKDIDLDNIKDITIDNVDEVDICEESTEEDSEDDELSQPPPEVVNAVFSSMIGSMPRTKEDVTGWCSSDDDDEEDPKIENMTTLAKELYKRFKFLHCQFFA